MTVYTQDLDTSVDLLQALLWRHNDATRLQSLLQSKQDWVSSAHTNYWADWVRDVFDLRTANAFGLSVWSVILGIPLALTNTSDTTVGRFAFGPERNNFSHGNFAASATSGLTLAQKRIVLQLRYYQLVTTGAVPEINDFMAYLFGDQGPVWVVDGHAMNALYVFDFPVDARLKQVLTAYDLLPRPAGVKVDFVVLGEAVGFGHGRNRLNFGHGNFSHA